MTPLAQQSGGHMEIVIRFIDIIAWIGAALFGFRAIISLLSWASYHRSGNTANRISDAIHGVRYTFPWQRHLMIVGICAAWIAASKAY